MQTGRGDESALVKAHNSAIIAGALRVFCIHTYHDMMRLYALGIDDKPEINFRAAAIKQILDPDSVVGRLQDIVERVIDSEDGRPTFTSDYNEIIAQVMMDYNTAYRAALQGDEAFKEYRTSVMLPYIANVGGQIMDADTEHEGAIEFLGAIDKYEDQWTRFVPSRPLERILQDLFPATT